MGTAVKSLKQAAEMCATELKVEYEGGGSETLWIRTRTYPEYTESQDALIRKRRELKDKYAPGTDMYDWVSEQLQDAAVDTLAEITVIAEIPEIMYKARKNMPQLIPPDTDGKSAAEAERLQEEYDKRISENEKLVQETSEKLSGARKTELMSLPREELLAKAIKPRISQRIDAELSQLADAQMLLNCVRTSDDHAVPYFDNIEQIFGLPEEIREMLSGVVRQIDTIPGLEIKNSAGRSVLRIGPAASTPEPTKARSTRRSRA